jgi:hypothetical protein
MNAQENDPLHAAINAKLSTIIEASGDKPNWYEAWMRLRPESTELERLRVYQAIRDAGDLPEEAGFYLVSWQVGAMTDLGEEAQRDPDEQLAAIESAPGFEEEKSWPDDEIPEEYEEIHRKYQDAWDKMFADKLEEFGEHDMARQVRANPEAFLQRSEVGRAYFDGPGESEDSEVPAWLNALFDLVAGNMEAVSAMGSLACRYGEDDGFWEVTLYPTPVELVGGAVDGEVVAPGFLLDLAGLRSAFDRVDEFLWDSLGVVGDEGPYVVIEGQFRGREVYLQILTYAPAGEEPGIQLDCSKRNP